ncbi:MAG: segregation/condensation protein A [Gammaproteobacteria bacterium]|nr:segregation/condensation protein A [Gammaproteobacteria bacterium]
MMEVPKDLYIPPHALEVILEAFEGPLDLLLYLIRKQDLDILNIPVAEITHQYLQYIKLMEAFRLELAAEYLLMAAMLAEIKSRMLLPRPKNLSDEEEDPRAELVRRLQEYERFKKSANDIDELPRHFRDTYDCQLDKNSVQVIAELPSVSLPDLMHAMLTVMQRIDNFAHHHIQQETLSLRERMSKILEMLDSENYIEFGNLFSPDEGKIGVVVTFMAILELCRESLIELMQNQSFTPIYIRSKAT